MNKTYRELEQKANRAVYVFAICTSALICLGMIMAYDGIKQYEEPNQSFNATEFSIKTFEQESIVRFSPESRGIVFSYDVMVEVFDSVSENVLKEKYFDCVERNKDLNSVYKLDCNTYLNKPSVCIIDSNNQQHCYKIIKEGVEK